MKSGDKVIVCTTYSCFDNLVGTVEEIVSGAPLPYTVSFEDGDSCYFSKEELSVLPEEELK